MPTPGSRSRRWKSSGRHNAGHRATDGGCGRGRTTTDGRMGTKRPRWFHSGRPSLLLAPRPRPSASRASSVAKSAHGVGRVGIRASARATPVVRDGDAPATRPKYADDTPLLKGAMLNDLWKYASRVTITIGALLTLIVIAELADLFLSIHAVNQPLAWIFAVAFTALTLGGLGSLIWSIYSHPPVLTPPKRLSDEYSETLDLRKHAAYLARYLRNLSRNSSLEEDARTRAGDQARMLRTAIGTPPTPRAPQQDREGDRQATPLNYPGEGPGRG